MTTLKVRSPRRSNNPQIPADAQSQDFRAGPRSSAHQTPAEKRINALFAKTKIQETLVREAKGAVLYWLTVALEVLKHVDEHAPALSAAVHERAFVCAVQAMTGENVPLAQAMLRTLGRLDPFAATALFSDLVWGPATLLYLVEKPDRLAPLLALPSATQAHELGKLIAEVGTRHQKQQARSGPWVEPQPESAQ